MSSVPTGQEVAASARWLVQALDPAAGLVRVIDFDQQAYRSASFLDDRLLQQPLRAHARPWSEVAAAVAQGGRSDARWIFHIGHVGSTLVARLLGELPGVLAVREPRILRDVAGLPPQRRREFIPPLVKLLSRTFGPDQAALVKATSFVGAIAAELVPEGERALFLYAAPRAYVATILAGENSRVELRHLADSRRQRMAGRISGLEEAAQSDAHLAAAAWACEMSGLEASAEAMPDRAMMWCDFDRMLDDMTGALAQVAEFFGFEASSGQLQALASGPLMRRYSKALEFEYSPSLRRDLLDEASRHHRAEIDSAIAMLDQAADRSPLLARALSRAQTES